MSKQERIRPAKAIKAIRRTFGGMSDEEIRKRWNEVENDSVFAALGETARNAVRTAFGVAVVVPSKVQTPPVEQHVRIKPSAAILRNWHDIHGTDEFMTVKLIDQLLASELSEEELHQDDWAMRVVMTALAPAGAKGLAFDALMDVLSEHKIVAFDENGGRADSRRPNPDEQDWLTWHSLYTDADLNRALSVLNGTGHASFVKGRWRIGPSYRAGAKPSNVTSAPAVSALVVPKTEPRYEMDTSALGLLSQLAYLCAQNCSRMFSGQKHDTEGFVRAVQQLVRSAVLADNRKRSRGTDLEDSVERDIWIAAGDAVSDHLKLLEDMQGADTARAYVAKVTAPVATAAS